MGASFICEFKVKMSEEGDFHGSSGQILKAVQDATINILPEKSRKVYLCSYTKFKDWCVANEADVNEDSLLAYFYGKSKSIKASSLWSEYSMVRSTLLINDNIDISKFGKLKAFLKRQSVGYRSKKSKILSRDEVTQFLKTAPDEKHLLQKIALIFGICGACRREELYKLTIDDVEDVGSAFIVNIRQTKTYISRSFVISGELNNVDLLEICRKYHGIRLGITSCNKYFLFYLNGKCRAQVVGINMFGKIPSKIAEYLKLENAKDYTGHCMRRSSATFLADSGADVLTLKRHGGWKSNTVAEGYVEESVEGKKKIADLILRGESSITGKVVKNNTSDNRENVPPISITNCNGCNITITIN